MQLPKLILTDIDGVWTDGSMYYSSDGAEFKRFNTFDSFGVLLARKAGIPVGIITGEDTEMVERRSKKLKLEFLVQGSSDKVADATEICKQLGIQLSDVAYIGDDIGDYKLLQACGISGAPSNAAEFVKQEVDYVTSLGGGSGAFRDFVEYIFKEVGVYDKYLDQLKQ